MQGGRAGVSRETFPTPVVEEFDDADDEDEVREEYHDDEDGVSSARSKRKLDNAAAEDHYRDRSSVDRDEPRRKKIHHAERDDIDTDNAQQQQQQPQRVASKRKGSFWQQVCTSTTDTMTRILSHRHSLHRRCSVTCLARGGLLQSEKREQRGSEGEKTNTTTMPIDMTAMGVTAR